MRIVGNNPQLSRQTQATASGAITGGKPVVVNTDGTVSEISATAVSVAGSVGTAINTGAADSYTSQYRLAYDTNRDKGMIVYRDDADSNNGNINILSVSGTDVSKSSDVAFHDGNVYYPIITFDSNNNMALVAFRDNSQSGYGRSKIISGSGTTATAGGLTTYRSASSSPVAITFDNDKNRIALFYIASGSTSGSSDMLHCITGEINGATSITWRDNQELTDSCTASTGGNSPVADACFDSNLNKVVLVYRDAGNSNHGTAVIGTFAGDGESITFGTPVVFNAANTENLGIDFDSNSNKVVIVYNDRGNSGSNTAIVGTVSGTTISFGSEVVFSTSSLGEDDTNSTNAIAFDSNTNKMNVFFNKWAGNGNERIYAIEGTVSGTSISFGTEVNLNSSTRAFHATTVFDPDTNQNIIAYVDISGNVNQQIYTPSSTSSNLTASTSEAFIGFAEDTVATGQPVTVNTKGTVDENQSSLTPAQQYFVQTNGTLGTSAGSPSVVAGTAVTATKLIVKG